MLFSRLLTLIGDPEVNLVKLTESKTHFFEAEVELIYDFDYGLVPTKATLACRSYGASEWEFLRPGGEKWKRAPKWLANDLNAQILKKYVVNREETKVVPIGQRAG